MIEDAILDVLELSDETYTTDAMAEYVGQELDEDPEYIKQIIDEMVQDGRIVMNGGLMSLAGDGHGHRFVHL